jgi:hypothetical protein
MIKRQRYKCWNKNKKIRIYDYDFIYHFLVYQKKIRIKIKSLMDPIKIKGFKLNKKKLFEVVTKVRRTNKKK